MFGLGFQELLVLAVIFSPVVLAIVLTKRAKKRNPNPEGLGGWLAWVAIGVYAMPIVWPALFYSTFFFGVKAAAMDWLQLEPEGLALATTLYTVILLSIFAPLEVWAVRLLVLFRQKRRRFPNEYMLFLVAVFALHALAFGFVSYEGTATSEDTGDFARGLIITVLWCAYIRGSKRVENTFVN